MESPHNPVEQQRQMFRYFGTFSRTMITMTELTLGNFVPVMRFLSENVNELYGYMIVVYKMIVGFAIVRVIGGVFLHETFKTVASDDELMVVQRKRSKKKHVEKMKRLVKTADKSQDGTVSREEFQTVLEDPTMILWLSAQ